MTNLEHWNRDGWSFVCFWSKWGTYIGRAYREIGGESIILRVEDPKRERVYTQLDALVLRLPN